MRSMTLVDFDVFIRALERGEEDGCHVVGFHAGDDYDGFYVNNPKHGPKTYYTVRLDHHTKLLSCNCQGKDAPWCKHRSVAVAFMVEHW